jgi:hypothetical protein
MNHLIYSYPDTMKNLRKTIKLLIVRDPWDRLLSAYRLALHQTSRLSKRLMEGYGGQV